MTLTLHHEQGKPATMGMTSCKAQRTTPGLACGLAPDGDEMVTVAACIQ